MKAFILYRRDSEFGRRTEEYVHDYQRTRNETLEMMDVDTVEGTTQAELYGIVAYPTLLIIREDNQLLKDWQGVENFPLMNELAAYLAS
ncbi:MAG TPA: hypothetical protein VLF87_01815 [Patescibacteria group bacterium]|nr:hypothetical protein [Patescibacteria group bacterium]